MTASRTCRKCGESKPLSAFPVHSRATGVVVHKSACKPCYAAYMRAYHAARPEQREKRNARAKAYVEARPDYKKRTKLRINYGRTLEEYRQMDAAQGGVCAICERPDKDFDKRSGKRRELAVDHCHDSGVIRGLLCGDCNRAIGLVKESEAILSRMIAYLAKHKPRLKRVA